MYLKHDMRSRVPEEAKHQYCHERLNTSIIVSGERSPSTYVDHREDHVPHGAMEDERVKQEPYGDDDAQSGEGKRESLLMWEEGVLFQRKEPEDRADGGHGETHAAERLHPDLKARLGPPRARRTYEDAAAEKVGRHLLRLVDRRGLGSLLTHVATVGWRAGKGRLTGGDVADMAGIVAVSVLVE